MLLGTLERCCVSSRFQIFLAMGKRSIRVRSNRSKMHDHNSGALCHWAAAVDWACDCRVSICPLIVPAHPARTLACVMYSGKAGFRNRSSYSPDGIPATRNSPESSVFVRSISMPAASKITTSTSPMAAPEILSLTFPWSQPVSI